MPILNIKKNIIISSQINYNRDLKGEEKIIEICKVLGSNSYYNSPGGVDLYNSINFIATHWYICSQRRRR